MPRMPRVKSFDALFHIMVRSISDVSLFRDSIDKDRYLNIVKKYKDTFSFKIYAYCLMDTHGHMIIDANGADISKIMHCINQSYAQYFNRRYNRHGHVFQDRFKSIIIDNDRYLLTVSAYIHNNPSSIKRYANSVKNYKYSSLGVYLGIKEDVLSLIDAGFILGQFGTDIIKARIRYAEFIKSNSCDTDISNDTEFKTEGTLYKSERVLLVRHYTPDPIIDFVSNITGIKRAGIHMKNSHRATELRALCVFLMRSLCNFRFKDICKVLGNITQTRVSKLCSMGLDLVCNNQKYSSIIQKFIEVQPAVA